MKGLTLDGDKRKLRREYKWLDNAAVRTLYLHDPVGIGTAVQGPPNEYEPEADHYTIPPCLRLP